MASLRKNGKYYYIIFSKVVDGKRLWSEKSLGITYKEHAQEAKKLLERLQEQHEIDPFSGYFNPRKILERQKAVAQKSREILAIDTIRKAADYFYQKKKHLSDKTVNINAKKSYQRGAYQRAIEHFISENNIAGLHPKAVQIDHFENIIYKDGIKASTRRFYYRQLRVFWNFLLTRNIVEENYFKQLRRELPKIKDSARPKMITKEELLKIFQVFDDEVIEKQKHPKFGSYWIQTWFKPMMACYFDGGLRKSEVGYDPDLDYSGLKGLNLEYIDGELEMFFIPATKGRKERLIPISNQCKKDLIPYLEHRGSIGYNDYIFVYNHSSKKGWPVTGSRAYREFKRYAKLAGLPPSRTLHGMRHRRITSWLEDGFSLKEGQEMAGHSSTQITEKYTHLVGKKLLAKQREIEKKKNNLL